MARLALPVLLLLGTVTLTSGRPATTPATNDLQQCGTSWYQPSQYDCFNNSTLCPKGMQLCGANVCYSASQYSCGTDGSLRPQSPSSSSPPTSTPQPSQQPAPPSGAEKQMAPFVLHVMSSNPALDGREVQACHYKFSAGANARTCVYCYNAPPQYECANFHNRTVLLPNGKTSAVVPGSQDWYINPYGGALTYAVGGKGGIAPGGTAGGVGTNIYKDGYFESTVGSSHDWLACPDSTTTAKWDIYSPAATATAGCESIKLVVQTVDRMQGAYTYA